MNEILIKEELDLKEYYKYKGFYIIKTRRGYIVEQFDTVLKRSKNLHTILQFIDDFVTAFNGM